VTGRVETTALRETTILNNVRLRGPVHPVVRHAEWNRRTSRPTHPASELLNV